MPLPSSGYNLTIGDHTVRNGVIETTTFSVPIQTLTPANVAATGTLTGNLQTAIAGITIGVFQKTALQYSSSLLGSTPAASPLAQRENKWLLRYHDATSFQKFTVSIGTADLLLVNGNTEFLDLVTVASPGLALKTAFEAVVVSPADSTHTVILDSVQFVGRNT